VHDVVRDTDSLQESALASIAHFVFAVFELWEVFLRSPLKDRMLQELVAVWPFLRVNLDHEFEKCPKLTGKMFGDPG